MTKKILIAEDEIDIVIVLKIALEKKGYKVIEAYDGLDALEKIYNEKPDLIVLDVMMPKMDGHSVNVKLKEDATTANIPVIIITGRGQLKEFIDMVNKSAVSHYFEKPFTVSSLLEKIYEILKE